MRAFKYYLKTPQWQSICSLTMAKYIKKPPSQNQDKYAYAHAFQQKSTDLLRDSVHAQSWPTLWYAMGCSRLLCPWDFPGKNTGAGCHFLLHGNLPNPGTEPESSSSPALAGRFWATWEAHNFLIYVDLSAWCLALFLREKRPECNNPLGIALYHPPSNNLIYKYGLVMSPRACFRLWLRQVQFRNWKMVSTMQWAPTWWCLYSSWKSPSIPLTSLLLLVFSLVFHWRQNRYLHSEKQFASICCSQTYSFAFNLLLILK